MNIGISLGITGTRVAGGEVASITATATPATSVLVVGDALNDTTNWTTFLNTSNYATDADGETIDTVVVNYIGDTATASETFTDGESNHFSITVTDTGGNERTFTTSARTVIYAAGTAPAIANGQSWTVDDTSVSIDASASGTGLTWGYVLTGSTAGVTINASTGLISGTPTGVDSGTATITATDQYGREVSDTFTYTASLRTQATGGADLDLAFVEDSAITSTDLTANWTENGNTLTYAITGTALPAGLSVSSAGAMTGTPTTVTADATYTLRGTDEYGRTTDDTFTLQITAEAAGITTQGFQASRDEGTTGDWFVDADSGDDSTGDGSVGSPYATIGKAVTEATSGDSIKLRAGIYPESVDISAKALTLSRYGTEVAIIDGGDLVTGWTQCDASDAPELGSVLGVASSPVYKTTVATSTIASNDPRAAFPYEDGEPLNPATGWLPRPRFPLNLNDTTQWLTSDATIVDGSNLITGYQDASLTDGLTQAQIENCDVLFHCDPNVNVRTPVSSFDTGTDTINLTDVSQEYETNDKKDLFALTNLLPAMEVGGWGYVEDGANTTYYIWPNDTGNLTAGIRLAARGLGVKIGADCEVRGLQFRQQSSAGGATDGLYPIAALGFTSRANMVVQNCFVNGFSRADGAGYGGIVLGTGTDWEVSDCTILNAIGSRGTFMLSSVGSPSYRGKFMRNIVENAEKSPFVFYGQRECFISRNVAAGNNGLAAHANKAAVYEGCDKVALIGNDFSGASGYLTHQETSRIAYLKNYIPVNYLKTDGRGLVDQNNATNTPAADASETGESYIMCNWIPPSPDKDQVYFDGIRAQITNNTEVTYTILGNISHGASVNMTYVDDAGDNIFTSGSTLDASDTISTPADEYTNATIGDFSFKVGSDTRAASTLDLSTEIAVVKAWLPHITDAEFDLDLNGDAVDWSATKVGAMEDLDGHVFDPVWVYPPEISGTLEDGETLTASAGFLAAAPYPTITRQWYRSSDGVDFTAISGETGTTYDTVVGDVGDFIGIETDAGGAKAFTFTSEAIASGTPVATSASRGATDDAYLTGPALASGTKALTIVLDIDVPESANRFVELFEYLSTMAFSSVDTLAGKRGLSVTFEDSAGTVIFNSSTPGGNPVGNVDGTMPAGRRKLVFSASMDSDGSNTALLDIWVDGVSFYSGTNTSGTGVFSSVRTLEVLRDTFECEVYEFSVYAGTHAQGYTSDGDVSGLTQIHSVSGAASNWNTPSGSLVKAGVDSFT